MKRKDFSEWLFAKKRHPSNYTDDQRERVLQIIDDELFYRFSRRCDLDNAVNDPKAFKKLLKVQADHEAEWGIETDKYDGHSLDRNERVNWRGYVLDPDAKDWVAEVPKNAVRRERKRDCNSIEELQAWLESDPTWFEEGDTFEIEEVYIAVRCIIDREYGRLDVTPRWPPVNLVKNESEYHAYLKAVTKNWLWLQSNMEPREEVRNNYALKPFGEPAIIFADLATLHTHAEVGETSLDSIFYPLYGGMNVLWVPYPKAKAKPIEFAEFKGFLINIGE